MAVPSGLVPFIPFVIASIIGPASQFYLPAFLANRFRPTMEPKIRQYVEWLGWGSVIVIAILVVWLNLNLNPWVQAEVDYGFAATLPDLLLVTNITPITIRMMPMVFAAEIVSLSCGNRTAPR
jgi:hypothetical protein